MNYKEKINAITRLLEAKDHLINKLDLTDEQKTRLIDLFKKHPNLESKIDWNNRNLTWNDFSEIVGLEGKSKSQAKKKGLSGLKEGDDYRLLEQNERYTVYYPMTHLASKTLADKVGPKGIVGHWCISENEDRWWNKYTSNGTDFFFIFTRETKYAVARTTHQKNWIGTENSVVVFNALDQELSPNEVRETFSEPPFSDTGKLLKLEETLPYQLDSDYSYNRNDWFKALPSGEYSKNGLKLITLNVNQPEIQIEPGTEWIEAQMPRAKNTVVKKIKIPASVKGIGQRAFQNLTGISEVFLPNSCDVGESAFQDCTGLLGAGSAFGQWPDREIQANTFSGCKNLRMLPLSNNVREIGTGAFLGVGEKIPELIIPDSVEEIKPLAFAHTGFKTITLPPHVIGWSYRVFDSSEVETLNINGQMLIPVEAFQFCKNLTTITGWNKDGMTSIEEMAFLNCTGLTELDMSQANGVYIEGKAFGRCFNLKTVKLPLKTALSWNSFQGCTSLTDVYFNGPKDKWERCRPNAIFLTFSKNDLLYVTVHCTDGDLQDAVSIK